MFSCQRRALVVGVCTLAVSVPLCGAFGAPLTHEARMVDGVAHALHPQTNRDLDTSMRGEAFAYASYTFFAAQADREGLAAIARLYRQTADVELPEHFSEEAALAGLVGSNAANLRAAISGETYESTTMYPTFARQAKQDGDKNAAALFTEIAKDEAAHNRAFKAALKVIETGKGRIPPPLAVAPVAVPAGPPKVSAARTKANLDTAMHGEALAHARYTLYAQQARQQGKAALAQLFDGSAAVELREHFAGEAALAGLVRKTMDNLAKSITGERYEANVMYPSFAKRAKAVGDTKAAQLFSHNARDEAAHALAFERALQQLYSSIGGK